MKKQQNEYIGLDGIKMPVSLNILKNSEWRKFNGEFHITQRMTREEKELTELKSYPK